MLVHLANFLAAELAAAHYSVQIYLSIMYLNGGAESIVHLVSCAGIQFGYRHHVTDPLRRDVVQLTSADVEHRCEQNSSITPNQDEFTHVAHWTSGRQWCGVRSC